jgi:hypothetical protein
MRASSLAYELAILVVGKEGKSVGNGRIFSLESFFHWKLDHPNPVGVGLLVPRVFRII